MFGSAATGNPQATPPVSGALGGARNAGQRRLRHLGRCSSQAFFDAGAGSIRPIAMDSTTLRSRPIVLLIAATLLMCLALSTTFVVLHRSHTHHGAAVEAPAHPLTDDETKQQSVSAARQFIKDSHLKTIEATYLLMSCRTEDEPPYQGTVYVDFDMPTVTEAPRFLPDLARTMTARGWTAGLDPNQHPGGQIMTNNGVTALIYRNPDVRGRGVLQIYGECRDVTDHRLDPTGFVDIIDELQG